jgi:hypothetical protein
MAENAANQAADSAADNTGNKQDAVELEKESKKSEFKEEEQQQIKGGFITKTVDLPGDILVLYWLAKAAFSEYDATEGEWIAYCIRQFYAEHSDEMYH